MHSRGEGPARPPIRSPRRPRTPPPPPKALTLSPPSHFHPPHPLPPGGSGLASGQPWYSPVRSLSQPSARDGVSWVSSAATSPGGDSATVSPRYRSTSTCRSGPVPPAKGALPWPRVLTEAGRSVGPTPFEPWPASCEACHRGGGAGGPVSVPSLDVVADSDPGSLEPGLGGLSHEVG